MNRILYVSDLDGTLLRSDAKISEYSCSVINSLVNKGLIFSYATARSLITAEKATQGLNASIPVITYNGAFVIDSSSKKVLISNFFTEAEAVDIKNVLLAFGVYPIVYAFVDGREKFSYHTEHKNDGIEFFLKSRQDDIRRTPVGSTDALFLGNTFYYTCIGSENELAPVYEHFKTNPAYHCIFQRDIYSHELWLELLPAKATKARAVLQLKELLCCDKVVSFGDSKNDIAMFQISDECYAVQNAVPELKEIATGTIESNELDSVAKWLQNNVKVK